MVKIDDYIESLKKIREEHGNLPIVISCKQGYDKMSYFSKLPEERLYYIDTDYVGSNESVNLEPYLVSDDEYKIVIINAGYPIEEEE